ncbi:putative secreted protein [Corynebacterium kutscheri]|uniref:Secreted protein n=2 Tax=Corynebacterium kutscheri TaxID=35755 RepID=A0A0F6TDN0_9CORY|nr:hypothetical protein UL82_05880 [Corynebacterium kutscheri]VEH08627.1 putative secreted protein [Corynebacterium kutscheri]VEH09673.1 putative secreted protein [Corynebacterium kutscheri]VEH79756.1 putative secreted protein [Corynebacterium kutscheri]
MTVLLIVLAVVITAIVAWSYAMAQRLNRLHIRTDSALQQLQTSLDRRAALVAVLIEGTTEACAKAQRVQLTYATFALRAEKEREVSAAIMGLQGHIPAPIVDAEARLQLAHRFYNEAVADTRALRVRPLVRLLRLGGTAKLPEFFEYTDYWVSGELTGDF